VNVDQLIADLVKAAYVKQAQGKVRESIQGYDQFHWGTCWFGYGSIFINGTAHFIPERIAMLPLWVVYWLAATPVALLFHLIGIIYGVASSILVLMQVRYRKQTVFRVPGSTLRGLWWNYVDRRSLTSDHQIELLSSWLKVLYDEKSSTADLRKRVDKILERQIKANEPYYSGTEDGPHFNFVPPVECLVMDFDKELGPYSKG
jgi:hypothetical protein